VICIGNVEFTDARKKAWEFGAIMTTIDGDKVRKLWHGTGPGCDFQAHEIITAEGVRIIEGRVRYHEDDKFFDSDDHKEPISFAMAPDMSDEEWEKARKIVLTVAGQLGIRKFYELDCKDAPGTEEPKLMEMLAMQTGGGLKMQTFEKGAH
jgi:hypothetical protein